MTKRRSKPDSRRKEVVFKLTPVLNPQETPTFGDIGVFFHVAAARPFKTARVELPYGSGTRLEQIDERTLRLFRWDEAKRSLALVKESGVDLKQKVIWGTIDQPGIYGGIGLPTDVDVLRTLGTFSLFSADELRDAPELQLKICGLILCRDPRHDPPWGSGTLCEFRLGLKIPELHLPEVQILRERPRPWGRLEEPPRPPTPVWPAPHHDYRRTCQSAFNGPPTTPSIEWSFTVPGPVGLSSPVVGSDGTV